LDTMSGRSVWDALTKREVGKILDICLDFNVPTNVLYPDPSEGRFAKAESIREQHEGDDAALQLHDTPVKYVRSWAKDASRNKT
jgi:hypothetical protein